MKISDLQKEAHAIAKEKGWWDEPRSIGELIALCHSELSEALREVRRNCNLASINWICAKNGCGNWGAVEFGERVLCKRCIEYKPVGFPIELADLIIRVADMAEYYGFSLSQNTNSIWIEHETEYHIVEPILSVGECITEIHKILSLAYIESRFLNDYLALVIGCTFATAEKFNIDLDAAIKLKMEYNKTRPYRHGGKKL